MESQLFCYNFHIQSYLSYIPFSYIPTSLISQLWRGTNFPILIPYKYTSVVSHSDISLSPTFTIPISQFYSYPTSFISPKLHKKSCHFYICAGQLIIYSMWLGNAIKSGHKINQAIKSGNELNQVMN